MNTIDFNGMASKYGLDAALFRSHRKVRQPMGQNAEISSAIEDMRRKARLERYGK